MHGSKLVDLGGILLGALNIACSVSAKLMLELMFLYYMFDISFFIVGAVH